MSQNTITIDYKAELNPFKFNKIDSSRLEAAADLTYNGFNEEGQTIDSGFMPRILACINNQKNYPVPIDTPPDAKSVCFIIQFETLITQPTGNEQLVTDASVWGIRVLPLELNRNVIFNSEVSEASIQFQDDETHEYSEKKGAAYLFSFNDSLHDFFTVHSFCKRQFYDKNIIINAVVETNIGRTRPLAFYLFYSNPALDITQFDDNFTNYLDECIIKTAAQRDLSAFAPKSRSYKILRAAPKILNRENTPKQVGKFADFLSNWISNPSNTRGVPDNTLTKLIVNILFQQDGKWMFGVTSIQPIPESNIHTIGKRLQFEGMSCASNVARLMYGAPGYPETLDCYVVHETGAARNEVYCTYMHFHKPDAE